MKQNKPKENEQEVEHETLLGKDATLIGLRDLMRKHAAGENIHEQKPDFTINSSTKNYAGGGMVHPLEDPNGIPAAIPDMAMPQDSQPTAIPSLSATASSLNQTPDTNYDFYGDVSADKRKALYDQLLKQQTNPGNIMAQAVGGLGDAISNSFGGQHNKFQDETRGIAEQNTANRIGAVDTQRQQKLQDLQGNQEMIMSDPNHPIAKSMQETLRKAGLNVPSGMPANVMLKVAGPLGELAMKQATLAVQQQIANQTGSHQKAEEDSSAEGMRLKADEDKRNALKETASHYFSHPINAFKASGELGKMGLEDTNGGKKNDPLGIR